MDTPTTTGAFHRRDVIAALGAAGLAAVANAQPQVIGGTPKAAISTALPGFDEAKGEYVLPPLPDDKAALEPHLDAQTMEIHHGRHHKAYVDGLNKALKALRDIREGGDAALIKHWSREVSFHGSGHVNHTLFWNMMAPAGKGGGGTPGGSLAKAIDRDFGGFDKFVAHFKAAAGSVEGGGWAWLVVNGGTLEICSTANQDNPVMGRAIAGCEGTPILGLDVWEHAYYLKYQNRRADYIGAWWNVVNWTKVAEWFASAR